jgi:hypothetical protein
MNLPVTADRGLVLRLISDVEQEKWFSNPFRYLIDKWDERGAALVGAACETLEVLVTKQTIEDLRIGYDVVMDMEIAAGVGHGRKPCAEDGMWEMLDTVLTLRTIGLEERFLKELFYKQFYHFQQEYEHAAEPKLSALTATICAMADVAESEYCEHDRKIEELLNAEVHDQ